MMNSVEISDNLITNLPVEQPEVRTAIADYVRQLTMNYADNIVSITLYGSQARGEASTESDIDLFIVIDHDSPDLRQALADLAWQVQFKHDVIISDIIRSRNQWCQMQNNRFPYYINIERDGLLLWKNTSALTPSYV